MEQLTSLPSISKRMLRNMRFIYCMLRKRISISKQKLVMDLHLLLDRRKVAGKTLYDLLITTTTTRHQDGGATSSGAYKPDHNKSYVPWDMDYLNSLKGHHEVVYKCDVAAAVLANALEMLNSEVFSDPESMTASPVVNLRNSPVAVMPEKDSLLPVTEEEEVGSSRVDREAEGFIQRFYENLRLQQLVPASP